MKELKQVRERVGAVNERIEEALRRAGREPSSVALVAVSKTFPAESVAAAVRAGLKVFGENRVQEAADKIPAAARLLEGETLCWHLVGHLQSNKAKAAVLLFDLIHSVDDAELAIRLHRAAAAHDKRQKVLIEVNVSGEGTKSGVPPDGLHPLVDTVGALSCLELRGLMTIPPYDPDPEKSRPYFAALRDLGEKAREWAGAGAAGGDLSMGMTEDFEIAIEEGATIVRIGRAIFGERPPA